LQQQLATATHDSIWAKALYALSELWQNKNLPKAIAYAKQGVKYAENWLPSVVVPLVLFSHLVAISKLLKNR